MFRQIIAIMLLFAFGLQTFQRTGILLGYYLNPGTFAKNCINKYRPQLNCNGQCQMMKKFKEEERKEQQNPERKLENKAETLLSSRSFFASFTSVSFSTNMPFIRPISSGHPVDRAPGIFHPPQA